MAGPLHLMKLCVGAERVEDLIDWQRRSFADRPDPRPRHVTRMWPRRAEEVLAGGSLYWVFRGLVLARQRIVALDEVDRGDGVTRCALVLDPEVRRTEPQPRRPFQGWRYLQLADAPRDLDPGREADAALPPGLAEAMATFGLR